MNDQVISFIPQYNYLTSEDIGSIASFFSYALLPLSLFKQTPRMQSLSSHTLIMIRKAQTRVSLDKGGDEGG